MYIYACDSVHTLWACIYSRCLSVSAAGRKPWVSCSVSVCSWISLLLLPHQYSVFPALPGKHSQADQRVNPKLFKILHIEGLFHLFMGMSPAFGFKYWHFKAPNYMSRRTFKEEDNHPSPPHSTNSNSRIFIKESWPTNQWRKKMPMTLVEPTRGGYRSGWLDEPFLQ